jgi:hypothetical protein
MSDQPVQRPRAYLFRILTNPWIDELRRCRPESWGRFGSGARGFGLVRFVADACGVTFRKLGHRLRPGRLE